MAIPKPAPVAPPAMPPQAPQVPAGLPPSRPIPGMPNVPHQELEDYLSKKRQAISRFGPDEEMNLQNQLDNRRNSLGYKVTDAGKGFADALMQGVARAGNPGWQNQFENQENRIAQGQMDTFRSARDTNMKQTEAGMSLDKMNPNSEISKSAQASYAPLFEKLGYQPAAISGMSAANIDNELGMMTQFGGAEIQAKIKEYELAIERARLGQATAKADSDERIAQKGQALGAAKELAGQQANAQFAGISIPFTHGPTDASKVGTKYLENQLAPYGEIPGYKWSPTSGKYHPLQQK